MLVNLCAQAVTIRHTPWECTSVYDFCTRRLIKRTHAGGEICLNAHPHAHYKQRLTNFRDIVASDDDGMVYIGIIDKPPSDEVGGDPVDVASLVDDRRKRLIMLQNDAFYIMARSVDDSSHSVVKKARCCYSLQPEGEQLLNSLVTHPSVFYDISPEGILDNGPIHYFNYLFGALKLPPVQSEMVVDVIVSLPEALRLNGGIVNTNEIVVSASFGVNSNTMNCRVRVQEFCKKWEVLIITSKQPGEIAGDLTVESQMHDETLVVVRHIQSMKGLSESSFYTDGDSVHRGRSVVTKAYDMMQHTAVAHKILDQTPLLMGLWRNAIKIGLCAWTDAQASMASFPIGYIKTERPPPRLNLRTHNDTSLRPCVRTDIHLKKVTDIMSSRTMRDPQLAELARQDIRYDPNALTFIKNKDTGVVRYESGAWILSDDKTDKGNGANGKDVLTWNLLTENTLNHLVVFCEVQMLACLRRLEKRCASNYLAKTRLGACYRLTKKPFRLHPVDILGISHATELNLFASKIGDAGMQSLAVAIGNGALPQLTELSLRGNQIGDVGMSAFADALAMGAMAGLTTLNLCKNKIGDVGMQAFAKALASGGAMANCQELYLDRNLIGDVGMTAFAQAIKPASEGGNGAMAQCQMLMLQTNQIGDIGMAAFVKALVKGAMAKLKELYLAVNQFGDVGMEAFASAVGGEALPNLQSITLNANHIGNDGITAFAKAIKPTPEKPMGVMAGLTYLNLDGTQIGDAGITAFADACAKGAMANVTELSLCCNYIGDVAMIAFTDALAMGALASCQTLNLSYNKIGDKGLEAFAQAIKPVSEGGSGALPQLRELYLHQNQIGDPGIASLADAFARGTMAGLTDLNLIGNQIGDAGMTAFAQVIKPVSEGGSGAMASLKTLMVDNEQHPELQAACQARCINLCY